jgi:4-amino-4-deoxy-L-arabinose transferase-like glycosyltransferase
MDQLRRLDRKSLLIALLGVITLFHVLTIRPGQGWGDDWAQYVAHAKNLVEGRSYDDTGYIYNGAARYAPRIYPPGFPVLLAPIYALRGLDLEALKIPVILSFIGALIMFAALAARWDGAASALIATAVAGFHPFFRDFKNHILSDLPFAFLLLTAIAASERILEGEKRERDDFRWGLVVGVTWWLAYSVRTVAVVLPVAFVLVALLRGASHSRVNTPRGAVFMLC